MLDHNVVEIKINGAYELWLGVPIYKSSSSLREAVQWTCQHPRWIQASRANYHWIFYATVTVTIMQGLCSELRWVSWVTHACVYATQRACASGFMLRCIDTRSFQGSFKLASMVRKHWHRRCSWLWSPAQHGGGRQLKTGE